MNHGARRIHIAQIMYMPGPMIISISVLSQHITTVVSTISQ